MASVILDLNYPVDFEEFKQKAREAGVAEAELTDLNGVLKTMHMYGHLEILEDGRIKATDRAKEFVNIRLGD